MIPDRRAAPEAGAPEADAPAAARGLPAGPAPATGKTPPAAAPGAGPGHAAGPGRGGPDESDRRILEGWAAGGDAALARMSVAVLMLADGERCDGIAGKLGVSANTVYRWRRILAESGTGGLAAVAAWSELIGPKPPPELGDDRRVLEDWASRAGPRARRARAALMAAEGRGAPEIAAALGVSPATVDVWLTLYRRGGPAGLAGRRGGASRVPLDPGERRRLSEWAAGGDAHLARMSEAVLMVADGETDSAAAAGLGVSPNSVGRWRRILAESGTGGLAAAAARAGLNAPPAPELGAGRAVLEDWASGGGPLARRARAALMAAEGLGTSEIAAALGAGLATVGKWLGRLRRLGPEGLRGGDPPGGGGVGLDDESRRILGARAAEGDGVLARMSAAVLMAADGRTAAEAARELGVSTTTVARWRRVFAESGAGGLADAAARRVLNAPKGPPELGAGRAVLEDWASGGGPLARRARAALMAADGLGASGIAAALGVSDSVVGEWLRRLRRLGPGGLDGRLDGVLGGRRGAAPGGGGLDAEDRRILEGWAAGGDARLARMSGAVLTLADGETAAAAAGRLGVSPTSVVRWRRAFAESGVGGLAAAADRARLKTPRPSELGGERAVLEDWASRGGPLARRARAALMAAEGRGPSAIAAEIGATRSAVAAWLRRFRRLGPEGLRGARGGAPGRGGAGLEAAERRILGARAAEGDGPLARMSWAVLMTADGGTAAEAAGKLGVDPGVVARWRRIFAGSGIDGLAAAAAKRGPGRAGGRRKPGGRRAPEARAAEAGPAPAQRAEAEGPAADGLPPEGAAERPGESPAAVLGRFGLRRAPGPGGLEDRGAPDGRDGPGGGEADRPGGEEEGEGPGD